MKLRHKENNCPKLGSVWFEPTLLRLGSSPTPCNKSQFSEQSWAQGHCTSLATVTSGVSRKNQMEARW